MTGADEGFFRLSLAVNSYEWDTIVAQTWYQTGVDVRWKNMVNAEKAALQSAFDAAVGAKYGAARFGGVRFMAVLAGMGVMGIILL